MSKTYFIQNIDDLKAFYNKLVSWAIKDTLNRGKMTALTIIVSKAGKRSDPQVRKYWALIKELNQAMREAGNILSDYELHIYVKIKSGLSKVVEIDGETTLVPRSLSQQGDMTKQDVSFLIEFIYRFAIEKLGVDLEG